VRVVERELKSSHTALVERLSALVTAETYAACTAAASASEIVRGYEDIKLRNVETFRARAAELLERIEDGAASPLVVVHHG
jgi:indolepyruvate ferredoxin oxidoreductase